MSRPSVRPSILASASLVALASGLAAAPAAAQSTRDTVRARDPWSAAMDSATVAREDAAEARRARRGFADSWFWGVKGGAQRFGTIAERAITAPTVGVDWLITRSHGALLVSAEQAFFDRTSAVPEASRPGMARLVDIENARRYSATIVGVPGQLGAVRPYAGLGLAIDQIRRARPRGTFGTAAEQAGAFEAVEEQASRASLLAVVGGQVQRGRSAYFAQLTGSPAQTRTLWNRGGTLQLEAGFRFNLARSVER